MNFAVINKNHILLAISLFICLIFTTPVLAAPTVHLDGRQLTFDVPPAIENSRTLVPLRAIFEAMGATVSWDQASQTATAVKDSTTVVLQIGSTSPTINRQIKQLDVPAKIVNGRTLAPLRFVGEAFGGSVGWDGATQTITISSSGASTDNPAVVATLQPATIVRVVDGDTLVVNVGGAEQKVRLILVDTPESVHPDESKNTEYGKLASDYTASQLAAGQTIYLQKDVSETDRYGRLLRYVWLFQPTDTTSATEVRAKMYNAKLLLDGYAQLYTYPPDVKYVDMFTTFQKEAREANRGLWSYKQTETVTETTVTTPPPAQSTGTYVGSSKSNKYHLPSCRHVESILSENQVWFNSEADATAAGYVPCGGCKPQVKY